MTHRNTHGRCGTHVNVKTNTLRCSRMAKAQDRHVGSRAFAKQQLKCAFCKMDRNMSCNKSCQDSFTNTNMDNLISVGKFQPSLSAPQCKGYVVIGCGWPSASQANAGIEEGYTSAKYHWGLMEFGRTPSDESLSQVYTWGLASDLPDWTRVPGPLLKWTNRWKSLSVVQKWPAEFLLFKKINRNKETAQSVRHPSWTAQWKM